MTARFCSAVRKHSVPWPLLLPALFITQATLFLFIGMTAAVCAGADTAKSPSSLDAKATSLEPNFTAVVVKDAGLWPQLQITDDGTLLAFGYNAPAHTTLPAEAQAMGTHILNGVYLCHLRVFAGTTKWMEHHP
jgi:hypothetical protein